VRQSTSGNTISSFADARCTNEYGNRRRTCIRTSRIYGHAILSTNRESGSSTPYKPYWNWTIPLQPSPEQAFEMPGYRQDFAATLGWALFPGKLVYQGGSTWDLKDEGQCFNVLLVGQRASNVKRATPIVRRNARGLSFVR
jgi:hypothetical protein